MNINECPSISSSDSESDVEGDSVIQSAFSGTELTLQDDDESPLLMQQRPEDEDEEEDEQVILYEDEGEGEGAEEPVAEPVREFPTKTGGDKKKKKRKRKKLYICLTNCKYDVVRRTSRKFGFKEVSEDDEWTLYWTDFSVALDRVMEMRNYQGKKKKINHFPGMSELCRKDLLARNLNRMVKVFPKEYNIFPKTWCLPADYGDFQAYTRQKKNKTYILKPESGCQGRGIWITRSPKDIKPHEHMICQVYTSRPYLIDGFKFDLRVYTLVTSCDPLRIFVFKDGLARFATSKYCEPTHNNADNVYMHLTNYAINKNSEDFVRDDEAGSKRRITTINRYLQGKGIDVEKIWADIDDVIIKTLISAHSTLKHNYRSCFPNHVKGSACFEILGFDILLDRHLRPYVIEVNHSPSFTTDAAIDREIKGALIWDTLNLVNFAASDRKRCLEEEKRRIKDRLLGKTVKKETKEELEIAQQRYLEHLEKYENSHMGNFRRIFPAPGCEKYNKYFHTSGTLFQETASFRARSELARQQREEISRKKEKIEMMQKGKKRVEALRPESPLGRRRSVHNNHAKLNPRTSGPSSQTESSKSVGEKTTNTGLPMDILEEEELERISGLLQRDNLVRGLGIVEHVYRLLHCTPGTAGVLQAEPKPQPLSLGGLNVWPRVPGMQSDSCLFTSGRRNISPIHIKAKDRSYYKKLLDRYFGMDHALAKLGDSDKCSNYEEHQQTVEKAAGISSSSFCSPKCLYQAFPQVRLTHSKQRNGAAHLNASNTSQTVTDISNEEASSDTSGERSKLGRKGAPGGGGRMGMVVQESEIHSVPGMFDAETEKSRFLARSGHPLSHHPFNSHSCVSEWGRSDTSTPARVRGLSATRYRESDLGTRFVIHPPGLSVVSAPAPVFQRPDIGSPHTGWPNHHPFRVSSPTNAIPSHRSTRSQRVRGVTNSVRLRELEMRENQAYVLS
ncbi:tubulin polyglutamylase ttll6-like isoform X2 [Pomacea canaliculata]|uniref:tubulin polyglutamylase ttll6-like isoform X2 n=1 Tax=Pomacea canaliculata TaxID=400727 RepID=UPI000D7353AF|nr:tubulin polyglutamylase ttll6-like isoform X2 [Pomacea canaliculata]